MCWFSGSWFSTAHEKGPDEHGRIQSDRMTPLSLCSAPPFPPSPSHHLYSHLVGLPTTPLLSGIYCKPLVWTTSRQIPLYCASFTVHTKYLYTSLSMQVHRMAFHMNSNNFDVYCCEILLHASGCCAFIALVPSELWLAHRFITYSTFYVHSPSTK